MIWTDCYKELVEIIRSKDEFLASIPDEYSELRERMENTPGIEHIDMWHEQVSFLDEEQGYSFSGFTRRLISGCFTKLFPIPTKVRLCRKRRCPFLTC